MEAGAVAAIVKHVHVWLVILSVSGFALRYIASQQRGRAGPQRRLLRIAPPVIDSLLLATGVALAWLFTLPPWHVNWLAAKLGFILAYILLGIFALRPALSRGVRRMAGLAAFTCALISIFLSVYKPSLTGFFL